MNLALVDNWGGGGGKGGHFPLAGRWLAATWGSFQERQSNCLFWRPMDQLCIGPCSCAPPCPFRRSSAIFLRIIVISPASLRRPAKKNAPFQRGRLPSALRPPSPKCQKIEHFPAPVDGASVADKGPPALGTLERAVELPLLEAHRPAYIFFHDPPPSNQPQAPCQ
jgi:hypothetical protein